MSSRHRHSYFVLDVEADAIIGRSGSWATANRIAASYQRQHARTTAVAQAMFFYQWDE